MCAGQLSPNPGFELLAARLTGRSVPAPLHTAGLLVGSLAAAQKLLRPPCPVLTAASTATKGKAGTDRAGVSTRSPGCW
jgi:hypothetical protein